MKKEKINSQKIINTATLFLAAGFIKYGTILYWKFFSIETYLENFIHFSLLELIVVTFTIYLLLIFIKKQIKNPLLFCVLIFSMSSFCLINIIRKLPSGIIIFGMGIIGIYFSYLSNQRDKKLFKNKKLVLINKFFKLVELIILIFWLNTLDQFFKFEPDKYLNLISFFSSLITIHLPIIAIVGYLENFYKVFIIPLIISVLYIGITGVFLLIFKEIFLLTQLFFLVLLLIALFVKNKLNLIENKKI